MEKVAIYCRTARQSDEAIRNQKNLCLNAINKKYPFMDLSKIIVYIDNGFPVSNDFAPSMKKLMVDLANDKINEIYTTEISRLVRNINGQYTLRMLLEKTKKDIYLVYNNEYLYRDFFAKTIIPELPTRLNELKEVNHNCDELERE